MESEIGSRSYPLNNQNIGIKGNLIPSILVSIYLVLLWGIPGNLDINLTWEIVLIISLAAFIIQKSNYKFSFINIFIIIIGLDFLGATVSLIRSTNYFFEEALWNTAGFGISIISFMLFIPVLSTKLSRNLLLISMISLSFAWCFEIQRLVNSHSYLFYTTFAETGSNKNSIGILLALSMTVLFYLSFFYRYNPNISVLKKVMIKLSFLGGGFFLLYNLSLIYARSSLLTATLGIFVILYLTLLKNKNKLFGVAKVILILLVISLIIYFILPDVISTSPLWEKIYVDISVQGLDSFQSRQVLLQKAFYLIGENPFLGLGIGGSRHPVSSSSFHYHFPVGLIHNSYLAAWVDKGFFGILSILVWIILYIKSVRSSFQKLNKTDQIWYVLIFLIFFAMLFKDLSSLYLFFLLIFTAINYEKAIVNSRRKIN